MGRKIPSKKHRGVKDPLQQQAKRWQSLKDKVNAPPRDPDEQPVPQSLLRLFAPRRAPRTPRAPEPQRPRPNRGGPLPCPPRLPAESARSYSRRLTASTRALIAADHSQHYPEEEADEATEPRRRRPRTASERPDKRQRQKEKLKAKREQERLQKEQESRCLPVYERLPFGEIAHAPPVLSRPRNAAAAADRPGARPLLLSGAGAGGAGEQARLRAVAAYRALRAARPQRPRQRH